MTVSVDKSSVGGEVDEGGREKEGSDCGRE